MCVCVCVRPDAGASGTPEMLAVRVRLNCQWAYYTTWAVNIRSKAGVCSIGLRYGLPRCWQSIGGQYACIIFVLFLYYFCIIRRGRFLVGRQCLWEADNTTK